MSPTFQPRPPAGPNLTLPSPPYVPDEIDAQGVARYKGHPVTFNLPTDLRLDGEPVLSFTTLALARSIDDPREMTAQQLADVMADDDAWPVLCRLVRGDIPVEAPQPAPTGPPANASAAYLVGYKVGQVLLAALVLAVVGGFAWTLGRAVGVW